MMFVCHELSLLARLLEAARGLGAGVVDSSQGKGLCLDDDLNNKYYYWGVTVRVMTNFGCCGLKKRGVGRGTTAENRKERSGPRKDVPKSLKPVRSSF